MNGVKIFQKAIFKLKRNFTSKTNISEHYNSFYTSKDKNSLIDLVILNTPDFPTFFTELWKGSTIKICADGGGNRLVPDFICGDLDSIKPDTINFYKERNVKIIHNKDDTINDLQKCLLKLKELNSNFRTVVVMNGMGGRFDQTMCNINSLYMDLPFRVVLLGNESVSFLLKPGKNIIKRNIEFERKLCGIIPIGHPSQITTKGLLYNLENSTLEFGKLISTSNQFVSDAVLVENSSPVLWTTALNKTNIH